MSNTNHYVILYFGLYPLWGYSRKHRVFSHTVSVFVCKIQRNFNVHISIANCNINNAAGILFPKNDARTPWFLCLFLRL